MVFEVENDCGDGVNRCINVWLCLWQCACGNPLHLLAGMSNEGYKGEERWRVRGIRKTARVACVLMSDSRVACAPIALR